MLLGAQDSLIINSILGVIESVKGSKNLEKFRKVIFDLQDGSIFLGNREELDFFRT